MLYNLSCSIKPGIVPALTQLPNNSKKKKKENNYGEVLAVNGNQESRIRLPG